MLHSMVALSLVACALGCSGKQQTKDGGEKSPPVSPADAQAGALANVVAVSASGEAGSYRFDVTIASPDTGCGQYANWWEVLRPDGSLVHRRILGHSHVDEQPFTRSSSPVAITDQEEILVRAHMHPGGYGGAVYRGSVAGGFAADSTVEASFAASLAEAAPQPEGCAF